MAIGITDAQANLINAQFTIMFMDSNKRFRRTWPEMFVEEKTDRNYFKVGNLAGTGEFSEKPQGELLDYVAPTEGYSKTYTNVTYARGYEVSEELLSDDMFGMIKDLPMNLSRAANSTMETKCAAIINNGFDNTYTYLDGLELFSDAHTRKVAGGTQANEPASATDLGETSIMAALQIMRDTTDDAGILLQLRPSKLWVPNELQGMASKLLNGQYTYLQGSGESGQTANPVTSAMNLNLTVWDSLTDANAWGLLDEMYNGLRIWIYWGISFGQDNQISKFTYRWYARMRFVVGVKHWQGIWASPGT